jgi:thiamine-monophosphate kinase
MDEFELIRTFFSRPARGAVLGVGDDCALLAPGAASEVAVTTDMMVEGRHFVAGADARRLGHKALAVNLSDLAAMGARPRWALLALALPDADPDWLGPFAEGLYALAGRYAVDLVGGDTTRGPRNITITALGEVPAGQAVRRSGARPGDDVWVSGTLGDAGLAVAEIEGRLRLPAEDSAGCRERLDLPLPRVELGLALRGLATAMIDVSDGLAGDLGHICEASAVGARIEIASLPVSECARRVLAGAQREIGLGAVLGGGDDYELCFTAPPAAAAEIRARAAACGVDATAVGRIVAGRGIEFLDAAGGALARRFRGFDHFGPATRA